MSLIEEILGELVDDGDDGSESKWTIEPRFLIAPTICYRDLTPTLFTIANGTRGIDMDGEI